MLELEKLAYLVNEFSAVAYGVELSPYALEDTKTKHPELKLNLASADERIFQRNSMDLVLLGCFLNGLDARTYIPPW